MNSVMTSPKDIAAALATSLTAAQVQLHPDAVVVYDRGTNHFIAYNLDADGVRISAGREWTSHHRLWMFFNTITNQYDAHIEYLEDYRPAIRVGDAVQFVPNIVPF